MQESLPIHRGDGPDPSTSYTLQRRGKRHDYFTSCLPWPQKGPGVSIPLGGFAPVVGNNSIPSYWGGDAVGELHWDANNGLYLDVVPGLSNNPLVVTNSGLVADLSQATVSRSYIFCSWKACRRLLIVAAVA